jgi:ADP-ribose pyrophosphatase YjhB (NUDIX family)
MAITGYFYKHPDAPRANLPTRVGVVALVEHAGSLLLDRRVDGGWGLIGGGVEQGESLTDALRREVLEESGLQVASLDLFGTFSHPSRLIQYDSGDVVRIITIAYLVKVDRVDRLRCSPESTELHFFSREELPGLDIVATHRHIVTSYLTAEPVVLE